ncbi:hypothetical protein BBK14_26830 [Parafrankia soli]|uniref:HTH lacI-type domain-containing protein n=1 Tax=Parafrankia soli TaxID=2599596 RepID=A0A1S1PJ62_9ACTN|nr:hypothetical protein BBK14_26830 [Parafrankia soli]
MSDRKTTSGRETGGRKPSATIYDIAKAVGVSPSTVSRALNKPGRINAKTEQRINDAAYALGYQVNPLARALPTGRTGMVAVLISDIANPVYFDVLRGAERVASGAGHTLVFADSQESPTLEFGIARRLQSSVDGLLLVASRLTDAQINELADTKPLVIANRRVDGIPSVILDVTPGLTQAINHLQELGHRSIGYLSGPTASWMNHRRWNTLLDECLARGLSIVEIPVEDPTTGGGAGVIRRILASRVTAVIAYNDLMALGVLREYKRQSIDVPGQLSIIGFDDIYGADFTTPSLTTVHSPLADVGEAAMRRLLVEANGHTDAEAPDLPTHLVIRESTAEPRH